MCPLVKRANSHCHLRDRVRRACSAAIVRRDWSG
ncbi:hypothetical protein [Sinorhizobium medicae]